MITKYQFIRDIAKLPFVERIILFGSRAREDNEERADIDLAIDCKEAKQKDWLKVIELVDEADTLLKVDCVRFDKLGETNELRKNIVKHGEIIYSKEQGFMEMEHWKDTLEALGQTIKRLKEAYCKTSVKPEEAEIYRDAAIQRFEFTVELFWKVLKKFLRYEKLEANTPREVLRKSYIAQIIEDEEKWLKMMSDRNKTSHTYNETLAQEISTRIELYLPLLEETYEKLMQRYQKMILETKKLE